MEVQKIEGISPDMLWTFCVVLVGLAALVVLFYKVVEIVRKERDRKQMKGQDITDRIATKVLEKLEPQINAKLDEIDNRFVGIDEKLRNDKNLIELHTRQLNENEDRVKKLEDGNKALCHGVFALLSHGVTGNSVDKLKKTQEAMKNYLIDGVYKEENWT